MARWSAAKMSFTPVAVADATNFTDSGYLALQGGSGTQRSNIVEASVSGQAAASAPTPLVLARDSTVGATLSGALLSALDPGTAALAAPPSAFAIATTKPQRSSTLQLLACMVNAFGGIYRWVAAPGEEIGILGNTASLGEVSLSCLNSGSPGAVGAHFIFEPF